MLRNWDVTSEDFVKEASHGFGALRDLCNDSDGRLTGDIVHAIGKGAPLPIAAPDWERRWRGISSWSTRLRAFFETGSKDLLFATWLAIPNGDESRCFVVPPGLTGNALCRVWQLMGVVEMVSEQPLSKPVVIWCVPQGFLRDLLNAPALSKHIRKARIQVWSEQPHLRPHDLLVCRV